MSDDAQSLPAEASAEAGRLPRLEWIKINQLRHVEPGSKIVFGSNFNVVLGKNGTGKTTLLELISAVVRGDFSRFAGEEFDVEYSFAMGDIRFECHFSNRQFGRRRRRLGTEFRGTLSRDDENWATLLDAGDVVPAMSEDDMRLFHPMHTALFDYIEHCDDQEAEFARLEDAFAPRRLFEPSVCIRVPEGADVFDRLFAHGRVDVRDVLVVSAREQDGQRGCLAPHFSVAAMVLLNERFSGSATAPNVVEIRGGEMQALASFVDCSQYSDASLTLSLLSSEEGGYDYGNPLARFASRTGDQITHYQLSFGEKRLLAFLIKLYACPSTIIVDELANGMHHSWIERAVELMEDFDTQAFLSSQDPLLIDCIPLAEDTFPDRNTFVLCEIAESGQLRWRNMTSDEAEDFFKSLAVGLERISEIMRSKGLW